MTSINRRDSPETDKGLGDKVKPERHKWVDLLNPSGEMGSVMNEWARALIFDLDGTLADSMPLHWRAWQALMRRHHFHFSQERLYALGGIPSRQIMDLLSREQGLALDTQAIAREKETEYLALLEQVKPIPAVVAIAQEHYQTIPLAIASGGSRRVIEKVLDHLQLRCLFDAVVSHEDVTRQKPAPDIFLEAARRLGVLPDRCRAYEDTDIGLAAIRAAGMTAVDVRELLAPQ